MRRPLTPEEERAAVRARIIELVWKLKLLTPDEVDALKHELADEPVLAQLRAE